MIIPFVSIHNALEAIDYYKNVFKAEQNQEMTMLSDIPGFEDDKYKGKVGHSTLIIQGSTIFINDLIDQYPFTVGNNIQFVLNFETEEELKEVFYRIAKDGELMDDLQEVHWGALFGVAKDKFDVTWQMYYGHK